MTYETPRRGVPVTPISKERTAISDDPPSPTAAEVLESQVAKLRATISLTSAENDRIRDELQRKRAYLTCLSDYTAAQHDLDSLEESLRQTRSQITRLSATTNLAEIDYVRTLSPPLARKLEQHDETEIEHQSQIAAFRKRLRAADKKVIDARQILAQPLDDLRADEILTEEAETSLVQAEERFVRSSPRRSQNDVRAALERVEEIEAANRQRSEVIENFKAYLATEKARIAKQQKKAARHAEKSKVIDDTPEPPDTTAFLDSMYSRLKERNDALEEANALLEIRQKEVRFARSMFEQTWAAKIAQIEAMTLQVRDTEILRLDIDQQQTENLDLQSELQSHLEERGRLQRRAANLKRDRKLHEKKRREIAEKYALLQQRRAELERQREKLEARRRNLSLLVEDVSSSRNQEKRLSVKVQKLEGRTREAESQNTAVFDRIQAEATELSASMLSAGSSPKRFSSLEDALEDTGLA
jgi:chromosome segregation ATPase